MSIMRGCSVHGKNVGLHGDKTSSGAQCIAARPGMSVMGLLKLYIGDKTTPCPKCGEVGVIMDGDHRCSNSAAVAVDGAEIRCGCPQGTNFLIVPGTIPQLSEAKARMAPAVAPEPEQHALAAKKKKREITLTIGVFFDGTGNNAVNTQNMLKAYTAEHYNLDDPEAESILAKCARENFGVSGSGATSYTGYYTNIHWLSTLYKQDISVDKGTVQSAVYIDGIGTDAGKPDSKLGQGFGISDTGVVAKTDKAVARLNDVLNQSIRDIRRQVTDSELVIKSLQFDIFGFSRGAAAARHFANRVQSEDPAISSAIRQGMAGTTFNGSPAGKTRFLGIFDTVAAIGTPVNGLNSHSADTARCRNAALRR